MSETLKTIGIVGGGLAGIAAAETAAAQGHHVHLFERSGVLGGRGASLWEPAQQQWIDTGQHILLGCCTEIHALNRRLGLDRFFERTDTIPFASVNQQHWSLSASPFLPKQWQLLPSFLAEPLMTLRERIRTCLLLRRLVLDVLSDITAAEWFKLRNVSSNALAAFWNPLILSSLSEMPDYVAVKALQKVVREGLLAGQNAMAVYLPTVPLRTIYHDAVSKILTARGASLRFFKRLQRLHWEKNEAGQLPTITALEFSDGTTAQFDCSILAIPAFQLWKVLEASDLPLCAKQLGLERFEPAAITTVHLWLDRPVLKPGKRYCMLSGGIGQFLCAPSHVENYYTVVISAAHRLLSEREMSGCKSLAEKIVNQLRTTFGIAELRLRHCRTTTCFEAVFSPKTEIYEQRPDSQGLFTNGTIAGDWTKTGFPATMEGAVRSGSVAVQTR